MAIDVLNERLLTFSQAAKSLPTRPSTATVWRWATRGVRGITLESIMVGGTRYTSAERLQEFCENVTTAAGSGVHSPIRRRNFERRAKAAEEECKAYGV